VDSIHHCHIKSRAPHGEVNGRYDDRCWISVI
jgi:hypothetical protein